MQVKQIDSYKHTKGSACFKLSLLRPSNPEDFPLGKSLTILETSDDMQKDQTLESIGDRLEYLHFNYLSTHLSI